MADKSEDSNLNRDGGIGENKRAEEALQKQLMEDTERISQKSAPLANQTESNLQNVE